MGFEDIAEDLDKLRYPEKAWVFSRFFKTGHGEYGEGDIFLGVSVPLQRKIARNYPDLSLGDAQRLLSGRGLSTEPGSFLIIIYFQYVTILNLHFPPKLVFT